MLQLSESCIVALTLSGVARLQQAFEGCSSPQERARLLSAAADFMDRTLPYPDLKAELRDTPSAGHVAALVANRVRIGAVPVGLWRPVRGPLRELSGEQGLGALALDRALRREATARPDVLWSRLEQWLAPAWAQYPALAPECVALKEQLQAQPPI